MTQRITPEAVRAYADSEGRGDELVAALTERGALDAVRKVVTAAARDLAPAAGIPAPILAVMLTHHLGDGVRALRDVLAGEAEADGLPVYAVGSAVLTGSPVNTRKVMTGMRTAAEHRRAATITGQAVPMTAAGWPVVIQPGKR